MGNTVPQTINIQLKENKHTLLRQCYGYNWIFSLLPKQKEYKSELSSCVFSFLRQIEIL